MGACRKRCVKTFSKTGVVSLDLKYFLSIQSRLELCHSQVSKQKNVNTLLNLYKQSSKQWLCFTCALSVIPMESQRHRTQWTKQSLEHFYAMFSFVYLNEFSTSTELDWLIVFVQPLSIIPFRYVNQKQINFLKD